MQVERGMVLQECRNVCLVIGISSSEYRNAASSSAKRDPGSLQKVAARYFHCSVAFWLDRKELLGIFGRRLSKLFLRYFHLPGKNAQHLAQIHRFIATRLRFRIESAR